MNSPAAWLILILYLYPDLRYCMNIIFLLFVQQHEASCFLELPEQNQRWPVPGEEQFVQSLFNCVELMLYDEKCYSFNLLILPLSYLPYLFCFLCQTRGGSNFRESRGLSSSTVDLYTGNWATGGQVASYQLICSPTQRWLFPFGSFSEPQRSPTTLPDRVGLPRALPPPVSVWPKDPFPPTFRPKDMFSHQDIRNLRACLFFPVCF